LSHDAETTKLGKGTHTKMTEGCPLFPTPYLGIAIGLFFQDNSLGPASLPIMLRKVLNSDLHNLPFQLPQRMKQQRRVGASLAVPTLEMLQ